MPVGDVTQSQLTSSATPNFALWEKQVATKWTILGIG